METPSSEPEMVSIRCPGCGQRFKVSPELDGKMVECGSCEHRFRVGEEVMVRTKKFYPGEHRDPSLEQFGRVPLKGSPEPKFQAAPLPTMNVAPQEHTFVEPVSPQRVILGFAGVIGAAIVALVMIFGGGAGGMLDGAPMSNRLVLVGFTSLVSAVLIFVANRHQKRKAVLASLGIAACLLPLPFIFKQGLPSETQSVPEPIPESAGLSINGSMEAPSDPYAELKSEIGYKKVAEALDAYGVDGVSQGKTAAGIWLRDIRLFNVDQVFDYLVRSTGANEDSWKYPRPPNDQLIVLLDVSPGMDRIAELCKEFGSVTRVIHDLNLVEVKVDNSRFVQGELERMKNPDDPSFYELNRRELESIDLQRALSAVKRIAGAEPKLYRSDIVGRLQELMTEGDLIMKREVARALTNWSQDGDGSVDAVRQAALRLVEADEDVPKSVIQFLIGKGDQDSVEMIHGLWLADSREWENLYGDFGPVIETRLLEGFDQLQPLEQLSAIRLLGRVGTAASLPVLEEANESASAELAVSIDRSIGLIKKRTESGDGG